jgi:two-component system, chemotaxis family, protein-glutamate methylesterase/glutaminase
MSILPSSPPAYIRVLLAESSAFMRRRLAEAIDATGDLRVVASVGDGEAALVRAAALNVDVLALEISLPRVDGLVVIDHTMRHRPRPIVAFGAHAEPSSPAGRAALEAGAVELVARPSGVLLDCADFTNALISQIRRAARVRVVRTSGSSHPATPSSPEAAPPAYNVAPTAWLGAADSFPVVVIASSTGGPAALLTLAARWGSHALPAILVAQHLPAGFTAELARQWQALCPTSEVREARPGDRPRAGLVLIAPGGRNLETDTDGSLRVTPPGNAPWSPSADCLFSSAAAAFGSRVRAFVLTGMGDDGSAGVHAVVQAGGLAWAQDSLSCVVDGMPAAARATGLAASRTLAEIATSVLELAPLRAAGGVLS